MEALRVVRPPGSCKSNMRASARMAKSADAADLKSAGRKAVGVQVPLWAPFDSTIITSFRRSFPAFFPVV
jgi:hypothetical protein